MRQVFEAVIGALSERSLSRAQQLVLDLVATQLHGQDLTDIWDIRDPMKTLSKIMAGENRGQPQARLLWSSGKETLLACYHVGIYSEDKELLGQGKVSFFFFSIYLDKEHRKSSTPFFNKRHSASERSAFKTDVIATLGRRQREKC